MDKYYIGTLNNISPKGLCRLTDKFELTDDVDISDVKKEHWAYNYICSAVRESK